MKIKILFFFIIVLGMFFGYSVGFYFADIPSFLEGHNNGYPKGVNKIKEIYDLQGLQGVKDFEKTLN